MAKIRKSMTTNSVSEISEANFFRLLQPINLLPGNIRLNTVSTEHLKGEIQGSLVQLIQAVLSFSAYFTSAQHTASYNW